MQELELKDIVKYKQEYKNKLDMYNYFSYKLKHNIESMLQEHNIKLVKIEMRVKSVDSFVGKMMQGRSKYIKPFESITDIIGIRIITYYIKDMEKIESILKREFVIDQENSLDKLQNLDSNQFGYRSRHYITDISEKFGNLAGWTDINVIKAEIQVRTALQHAWAAIDHKLRYKNIVEMPSDIKRKLFRISALLELADEEFETIRNYLSNIEKYYLNKFNMGDYNVEINPTSLAVYLKSESKNLKQFQEIMRKLDLLDSDIIYEEKPAVELIHLIKTLGLKTIDEIDDIIGLCEEKVKFIVQELKYLLTSENKSVFQISNYINIFIFILIFKGSEKQIRDIDRIDEKGLIKILDMREKFEKLM